MSIKVMSEVWATPCGSTSAKIVMLAIADHANDNGHAWPSITGIAKKCDMSRRNVMRIIQSLEKDGLLKPNRDPGRTTRYSIQLVTLRQRCQRVTGDKCASTGDTVSKTGDTVSPKPSEPSKPSKKVEPSQEGFQFSNWFESLRPSHMKTTSAEKKKWAEDYDKLKRLDGKSKDQIKAVCKWARKDDFWQTNFLSPLKLRKKNKDGVKYFDVFETNMKTKTETPKPKQSTAELNGF